MPWNKSYNDNQSVNKLDVMDYLEQFGDLPWKDCAIEQV